MAAGERCAAARIILRKNVGPTPGDAQAPDHWKR